MIKGTNSTLSASLLAAVLIGFLILSLPLGLDPVDAAPNFGSSADTYFLGIITLAIAFAIGALIILLFVRRYPGVEDGTGKRPMLVKFIDCTFYARIILLAILTALCIAWLIVDAEEILVILTLSMFILAVVDVVSAAPIYMVVILATIVEDYLTGLMSDIVLASIFIIMIILLALLVRYFRNGNGTAWVIVQVLMGISIAMDVVTIVHYPPLETLIPRAANIAVLVVMLILLNRPACREFFSIESSKAKAAPAGPSEKPARRGVVKVNKGESERDGSRPHPGYIVAPVADILFERGYISKDRAAYDFTNSRTFQDYVNNPDMEKLTPTQLADLFENEQKRSGTRI